jgi:urea transport system substrate-binding protein
MVHSARTLAKAHCFGVIKEIPMPTLSCTTSRAPAAQSSLPPRPIRVRLPALRQSTAQRHREEITVALCVPLGGTAGIWGPSALASARLAVAELNRANGIGGKPCRLLTVNAADDAADLESTLAELVESGEVDALVGMHTSAVRQRIQRAVGGHVPFVYTPLYEGGETSPGVFAIGETTARQLRPALAWLSRQRRPRRWLAVGNDYVWPRATHHMARRYLAEVGAELVGEHYVPFGTTDYTEMIDHILRSRADAVLVSLIGQDAIDFNRAFGHAGLSRTVLRLSCALGENELLGIGAACAENLFVACGYFASLDTDANLAFKQRYHDHFGERAPTLNTFGQSTYEGVHYLAALFDGALHRPEAWRRSGMTPLAYRSARVDLSAGPAPIYLATAENNVFRVISQL